MEEQLIPPEPTTERVRKAAHNAIDLAAERSLRAEERARQFGRRVYDQSRDMTDSVARYVDEHPLTALGIAAGVGFVLASLMRRR